MAVVVVVVVVVASSGGSSSKTPTTGKAAASTTAHDRHQGSAGAEGASHGQPTVSPFKHIPPGPPSDQRRLVLMKTIGGHISPKSVDASDTGLVFAQNMMYTHTVTVYNSSGKLVKTIPDTVQMSRFGFSGHPGITHGAPVEAAFTPNAKYVYVSNYSMYGSGFGPEGSDDCTPASATAAGDTDSYVYRINVSTLSIDQVIKVGLVPKYMTVTPNGRYLLVSNWCSYDLSVVDIAKAKEIARLPMGPYPRGLAVSPDSKTAYVAIMGSDEIVKVNLTTLKTEGSFVVGDNPRHLVMSPNGRYLYASLNGPGDVVKVDLANDRVIATVHTGVEDRSLAISTDGRSLYVVNYDSDTITKLRASDLHILQTFPTGVHPIGITYDATTGDVWVAVYSGQILVLGDKAAAQ
ncbi:MAG: cytochrome D1 domain-containing protein [Solirubrobacteraceae bacterium]